MLLAVDPGNDSGWALTKGQYLFKCGLTTVDSFVLAAHVEVANKAIIEIPQVYPSSKVPPNDLIKLAVDVGRYQEKCYSHGILDVQLVRPATWKGQTPKSVQHQRLWVALSPDERDVVAVGCKGLKPSVRHNVLDACCLALYGVGRKI